MEQMAVQLTQQDMMAMLSAAGLRTGGRTQQGGGDPFLQIIQNMVAQMMTGQETEGTEGQTPTQTKEQTMDPALLAGFAGMLFGTPSVFQQDWTGTGVETTTQADALLQQITTGLQGGNQLNLLSEDAKNLLLQAAQTSWNTPLQQLQSQTQMSDETVQSFAQTIVANTQRQSTMEAVRTLQSQQSQGQTQAVQQTQVMPQAQAQAVQQEAGTEGRRANQSTNHSQTGMTTSASSAIDKTLLMGETTGKAVETTGASQSEEGESLFRGQQKFGGAVAQARQMMAGQNRKSVKETEEVPEQVVTDVRTPQPQSGTVKQTEAKPAETPRLLDQLTDGLNEEISAGKKEFTMKLKPEELGEITVKLTEKAGKMVVSITTASAQTAKLLNSEMPALRETMRPMQVEVHEAVSQSAQSNQAQMQFNMSGQQFANQQRAFAWQQEKPYYAATSGGEAEGESDAPQTTQSAQSAQSAGLNLYV